MRGFFPPSRTRFGQFAPDWDNIRVRLGLFVSGSRDIIEVTVHLAGLTMNIHSAMNPLWSRMPNEIFGQILDYLPSSSLCNAALVNHHFRNATYPLLYRWIHVDLRWKSKQATSALVSLIEALFSNGNICGIVRRLTFQATNGEMPSSAAADIFQRLKLLYSRANSLGLPVDIIDPPFLDRFTLTQMFSFGLLMALLPRLHTVELFLPTYVANKMRILNQNPWRVQPWHFAAELRTLHIIADDAFHAFHIDSVFSLLRHAQPHIQRLTIRGICPALEEFALPSLMQLSLVYYITNPLPNSHPGLLWNNLIGTDYPSL
ncbi:hypothetical protein QBC38DRAFT_531381 [Podospora fimiseda]|uniref:F-box domain-containing protein n=1 Tax=Podospora fimiseda TaxID=252190 RepID=A0AAN7GYK1_9PEZI|nr:hypothetical protein QBC38DRAFT_531381 [Podospora fimiseda]